MTSSLQRMLEVSKTFEIGGEIIVKGYKGVVMAFSDEHLFCAIPEVALTPDEIDLGAKKARDRELESYRNRVRTLEVELDRMINDREYADRRQMQARERRDWDRNRYHTMDYGTGIVIAITLWTTGLE